MSNTHIFDELEKRLQNLAVLLPSAQEKDGLSEVNAADFGVSEEVDNTKPFQEALAYCRENGIRKLTVPKGVYHFRSCEGESHLPLDDMEDFVFDGQGSEFIFETVASYISVKKSRRILVKNLVLDWNWEKTPLASIGTVTDVASDGSYIECVFPEREDVPEDMRFSIVGPFDPKRYTPGCAGGD